MQFTHVGNGAPTAAALAERFSLPEDAVVSSPFVLSGSLEQVIDQLERGRERLGISHVVVRDAAGFADVVAALDGR
ncbi:MAG: hypothetical protein ABIO83_10205 [Ilumatobacteraceae bacterium]